MSLFAHERPINSYKQLNSYLVKHKGNVPGLCETTSIPGSSEWGDIVEGTFVRLEDPRNEEISIEFIPFEDQDTHLTHPISEETVALGGISVMSRHKL